MTNINIKVQLDDGSSEPSLYTMVYMYYRNFFDGFEASEKTDEYFKALEEMNNGLL